MGPEDSRTHPLLLCAHPPVLGCLMGGEREGRGGSEEDIVVRVKRKRKERMVVSQDPRLGAQAGV